MELPFRPHVSTRPNPNGGRPIVRRDVDMDTITREMAVPTEAIAERARGERIPPILPAAGIELELPDADLQAGYL